MIKDMDNKTFITERVTNKQIWEKLNTIDEMLKIHIEKETNNIRWVKKIAYSALMISLFISGTLITKALGG